MGARCFTIRVLVIESVAETLRVCGLGKGLCKGYQILLLRVMEGHYGFDLKMLNLVFRRRVRRLWSLCNGVCLPGCSKEFISSYLPLNEVLLNIYGSGSMFLLRFSCKFQKMS